MKHFSPVFFFLFHFLLNRCWWIFEFQECEFEISQKGELVAKLENKTKEISQMLNNLNTMSQNDRSENGDTSQNKTTAEKGEKWLYQWYQLVAKSERKSPYFIFLLMSHSWHNLAGNSKLLSKHAKQISNSISIWQTNLSFLSSTFFNLLLSQVYKRGSHQSLLQEYKVSHNDIQLMYDFRQIWIFIHI